MSGKKVIRVSPARGGARFVVEDRRTKSGRRGGDGAGQVMEDSGGSYRSRHEKLKYLERSSHQPTPPSTPTSHAPVPMKEHLSPISPAKGKRAPPRVSVTTKQRFPLRKVRVKGKTPKKSKGKKRGKGKFADSMGRPGPKVVPGAIDGFMGPDPSKYDARVEYEAAMRDRVYGSAAAGDIIFGPAVVDAYGTELGRIHGVEMTASGSQASFLREMLEKQSFLTDSTGVRTVLDPSFTPPPGKEPKVEEMPKPREEAAKALRSDAARRVLDMTGDGGEEDEDDGVELSLTGRQVHLMADAVALDSSQMRGVLQGGGGVDDRTVESGAEAKVVDGSASGIRQLGLIQSGRIFDSSQMKGIVEATATKDPSIFHDGDEKRVLLDGEHAKNLDLVGDQHFYDSSAVKASILGEELPEGAKEAVGIAAVERKGRAVVVPRPTHFDASASPDDREIAARTRYYADPESFAKTYARRAALYSRLTKTTGAKEAFDMDANTSPEAGHIEDEFLRGSFIRRRNRMTHDSKSVKDAIAAPATESVSPFHPKLSHHIDDGESGVRPAGKPAHASSSLGLDSSGAQYALGISSSPPTTKPPSSISQTPIHSPLTFDSPGTRRGSGTPPKVLRAPHPPATTVALAPPPSAADPPPALAAGLHRDDHYRRTLRESDAWSPIRQSEPDAWVSTSRTFHTSPTSPTISPRPEDVPWSRGRRFSTKGHVKPISGSPWATSVPGGIIG